MAIAYEWFVEDIDECGDIQDVNYYDTYTEVQIELGKIDNPRIGLCKTKSNKELDSVDSRAYSYIVDGVLESTFDDYSKVPEKYRKQVIFKL